MAKRKPKETTEAALAPVQEALGIAVAEPVERSTDSSPDAPSKPAIVLRLREDGSIDWESMRSSTKEKAEKAIRASGFSAPSDGGGLLKSEDLHLPIEVLGAVEVQTAVTFFDVPEDLALQHLAYSKPEVEKLSGPLAAVLNKYPSSFLLKYREEIALASVLVVLHQEKISGLRAALKRRTEETEKSHSPRGMARVQGLHKSAEDDVKTAPTMEQLFSV